MVLFGGLWKTNNNRHDYHDGEQRSTAKHQHIRPSNLIPPQQEGQEEDSIDQRDEETNVGPRDPQQGFPCTSSSSSKRKKNRGGRSNYVSTVLFGGLWARSNDRRQRLADHEDESRPLSSDHDNHVPYGSNNNNSNSAVQDFELINSHDKEKRKRRESDDKNQNGNNDSDDDDGSNFPSLTNAFNPDEVEWDVVRLCVIYLTIYALVAVVAYCYVFEHWTVIDALYFAVCTFTTVGYGDLQPTTAPGQLFTIVFAIYGVIILGIFIGIFGHAISEGQAHTVRKLKAGRQRKLVKLLFQSTRKIQAAQEIHKAGFFREHQSIMDDIRHVIRAELPSILVVMVLAFILGVREGWSITSICYFAIMSASTTGYGDYTPATQIDKVYCIFFLPVSIAVFGEVLGRIASVYITRRQRQAEQKFLRRNMTTFDLHQMDTNDDGMVSMEEWLTFMLVSLQKVDPDFLDDLKSIFYDLDTNGNGYVDKDDLVGVHKTPQWRQIQAAFKED